MKTHIQIQTRPGVTLWDGIVTTVIGLVCIIVIVGLALAIGQWAESKMPPRPLVKHQETFVAPKPDPTLPPQNYVGAPAAICGNTAAAFPVFAPCADLYSMDRT